jgi:restriction system protein
MLTCPSWFGASLNYCPVFGVHYIDLFNEVRNSRKTISLPINSVKTNSAKTDYESTAEENFLEPEYTQLLPILKALSPDGFERLCQRLLREHGFQNVKVTGRSGDGGIDGEGVLELNPLLSFKVIFQCKRYQGSVGSKEIRDFRGAMVGRADKGILLTTGNFTMEAKKEAVREGTDPIELVDGEKLVKMFERLELGMKPRTVYEVDPEFFKEYK